MTIKKAKPSRVIPIVSPTPYDVGDVNMFLVADGSTLTLIDAGDDSDECWEAFLHALSVNDFTIRDITGIWITHSHQDHIGLLNRIGLQHKIPVYAHKDAIPRMKRDPTYIQMRIRFFKRLYDEMGCGLFGQRQIEALTKASKENEKYTIHTDIIPVSDGDAIGNCKVLEVPGHAPDHIAFWDEDEKRLFAGDHLIKHISSNAFVEPDSEGYRMYTLVKYTESLAKCLTVDAKTVFAGHGEFIHDHQALISMRLKRIEQKAQKITELIREGATTPFQLAQRYYPDKYVTVFAPVMSEIIGLLDLLDSQDKVQKFTRNGVWQYEA